MVQEASVAIGADNSQLLRVLAESKSAMTEFFTNVTEEGHGVGSMLEDIQGKFTNAFNFAGLTVGIEIVKQIGEAFERMGQQAAELRTVAEVIGVSTDQLQAMRQAAEESGVGADQLTHAGERLVSILSQARDGSSDSIDKLIKLGLSIEQVNDPTFKLTGFLEVLRDRLLDASTAESTMNELMLVLGNRAALAAEAIKKYDGSAEHVKEIMAEINGLSADQIDKMQSLGARWNDFTEKIENSTKKLILNIAAMGQWIQAHNATVRALGEAVGAPTPIPQATSTSPTNQNNDNRGGIFGSVSSIVQQADEIVAVAQQTAQKQEELEREMALQELQNIKAGVDAYKQGSLERLEQLKAYAAAARQYYGSSDVDIVKAADQAVIVAQRQYNEEQKRQADELAADISDIQNNSSNQTLAIIEKTNREIIASISQGAREQEEAQTGPIDRQIAEIQGLRQLNSISAREELSEVTQLLNQKWAAQEQYFAKLRALYATDPAALARVLAQEEGAHQQYLSAITKAQVTAAQEIRQQWQFLTSSLSSGFSSALKGILNGTMSVGAAMESLFTSVLDGIIDKLAQWSAEWLVNAALVHTANTTSSTAQVINNAGVAATAAMGSVAAIPFVGWAMAPEVGAEIYAEALALGLPKAMGGWDIPNNLNPITQLHGGEMVLPKSLADPFRDMVSSNQRSPRGSNSQIQFIPVGNDHGLVTMSGLRDALKQLGFQFKLPAVYGAR